MKLCRNILLSGMILLLILVQYILVQPMLQVIQVSTNQALVNRVIVVDPGHGGRDNGAEVGDIKEDEINLKVALALKTVIEQAGGTVVLIRDDDFDLSSEYAANHKKEDLAKRVGIMNQDNVDLFISIHMNKYGKASVKGGQVFYQALHPLSNILATQIQNEFRDTLNSKMLPKVGNYYVLNETSTPGVLVECGFLSNPDELILLQKSSYQTKIAFAIYEGLVEYFRQAVII